MMQITFVIEHIRWRINYMLYKCLDSRLTTNKTAVAETEYGQVKGIKRMTVYGDSYYSFESIPYAQPPIGELRFKAPQKPTPWNGVLDCTNYRNASVQKDTLMAKISGSEDCLHLSVFTNNLTPENKRPVLVFIHGGAFKIGDNSRGHFGPDYFIKKDVVLITIQYRLGVFGFLSLNTEDLKVPGNASLKDQVMALRWVKSNCAFFGGDPDNITIFGQSAGGALTHYMMMTEQTRGIFHRAVLMSGNAVSPWASGQYQDNAFKIAKLAGYVGADNDKEILEFLMKVNAYDLAKAEEKVLTPEDFRNGKVIAFGPTVEPYQTEECVIPKPVREMAETAWGNSLPTMMGATSYEGLLMKPFITPEFLKELETAVTFVPAELVEAVSNPQKILEMASRIKKAHVADGKLSDDNLMDLFSYMYYWFPLHRLVQLRLRHSNAVPIYLYRFDYDSEEIIYPYRIMRLGRGVQGVGHADELSYMFWHVLAKRLPQKSTDYKTIERMIGIWTQFASTGNPYSSEIEGLENQKWNPVEKSSDIYRCLNISDELKVIDLPEMKKIKVWESLFKKHMELF